MLYSATYVAAQVSGKVVSTNNPNVYTIVIVPEESIAPPYSITNTASITLKVPTGKIQVNNLTSQLGQWELANPIVAPAEAPNQDYLVFHLSTSIQDFTYEAGKEYALFSFENTGDCLKYIQFIDDEKDDFLPPNSLNANVGNWYSILGYGGNAFQGGTTFFNPTPCTNIRYNFELSEVICAQDSAKAKLTYEEGTPPMRVVLKLDNSFQATIDTFFQLGAVINYEDKLSPGDYTLFMTDAAKDTARYTFTIEQPEELNIAILYKEDISCNDKDGALVNLRAEGLRPNEPYELEWSTGQTEETVTGLSPGPYQVTLTDSDNCDTRVFFEIDGIPPIDIKVQDAISPSCPEKTDGLINVAVEGGIGIQYFYEWNDPTLSKSPSLEDLQGGEYELKVFDVSGCYGSSKITLDTPPPLEPAILSNGPTCPDFQDGKINIAANEDGALPFTYSLNGGTYKQQEVYEDLPAGTYNLHIVDNRDCFITEEVTLEEPEGFDIELGENREFLIGEKRPLITGSIPDSSYYYEWFPSEGLDCSDCPNPMANPTRTTTYSLIATNEVGCYQTDEVTISVNLDRPVYFPSGFSPNGDGNNDFFEIPPGKTTSKVIRLKMFDRWGQLIYDSGLDNGDVRWDGTIAKKPISKGVYIFAADILFADGKVLQFYGDVMLVR